MIFKRSATSIELTYTPDEYQEFSHAIASFRKEIDTTLRNEIPFIKGGSPSLDLYCQEVFSELIDELIQFIDDIEQTMIVGHNETSITLVFNLQEYKNFNGNVGSLRDFLIDFQEGYHHEGENEKENAFEAAQDLIDIFMDLGDKLIFDK